MSFASGGCYFSVCKVDYLETSLQLCIWHSFSWPSLSSALISRWVQNPHVSIRRRSFHSILSPQAVIAAALHCIPAAMTLSTLDVALRPVSILLSLISFVIVYTSLLSISQLSLLFMFDLTTLSPIVLHLVLPRSPLSVLVGGFLTQEMRLCSLLHGFSTIVFVFPVFCILPV